ncbi:MAG: hypothetical protein C5B59_11385 [Bacteroidetes bacterium]|nr:MAG: hypothetical protein C5B59_11385 [Bacteroidota bacterium]
MSIKKKILLFADWYEPGYKAGGPIRSCVNFVGYMSEDFQIHVFTSDRDLNSRAAYDSVPTDQWLKKESGEYIFYCSPQHLSRNTIREIIHTLQPDYIYLNSMFSKFFTIYPLLIGLKDPKNVQIILSPRGMLRKSALQFKSFKKKIYLQLFRQFGLHKKIFFQAADETEQKDILQYFGSGTRVQLIPNFPSKSSKAILPLEKSPGNLFVVYVGRIHPIKNLDYLLQVLGKSASNIRLTIVGSIEDPAFWKQCEQLIANLPRTISVSYMGEMPNDQLPEVLKKNHIFSLPTKGENFGHAIFEALSFGKPVLISDQTPWRNLELAKVGWDLPLEKPEEFAHAIAEASAWSQDEYNVWSKNAFDFARKSIDVQHLQQQYRQLFA